MRELLELWNPWWEDEGVPPRLRGITRGLYLEPLAKETKSKFVSVITGPRRTGKTTLMYQTIQHLIDKGVDPKHILYAMLDSPALPFEKPVSEVLREFRKRNNLARRDKVFLFLDEAQYIPDWARWAKAIHDSENAKLFISGSTSAMIEQDSHASLTGRWCKTMVFPLTFAEFLEFKGAEISLAEQYRYERYLEDYARTGGFPEVVCCQGDAEANRLLTAYFDDFVFKDAARTRAVRDLEALKHVASLMARSVGTTVSVNKLARTLKVSTAAVASYINALCSVFLYYPCQFYSHSATEQAYNPKKYYLADTGLGVAVTSRFMLGTAVENLVHNHLMKRSAVNYWRSLHEVDFYLPGEKFAMEVKYHKDVGKDDIKGLLDFAKKMRLKEVFVATASQETEEKFGRLTVKFLPAWKVLIEPAVRGFS